MSILSTIIKDVESFASKFEKELAGEGFDILDDSAENAHGVLRLLGATCLRHRERWRQGC